MDPGYRPPLPPAPEPDPEPALPRPPKRWYQRLDFRLALVLAVVVIGAAWNAGTFDHALVNVGLNAKDCARNGFGATFCGQELEERRAEQGQAEQKASEEEAALQRQGEEAQRKADEELADLKRKGEEAETKLRHESEAAERAIEQPAPLE